MRHYQSQELFWKKVNKDGPIPRSCPELSRCWVWTASLDGKGYGQVVRQWKHFRAHRVVWEEENGPIPKEVSLLHHCDNRACVRPSHMFLGDNFANMRDCASKRRNGMQVHPERNWNAIKSHCPRGHEYSGDNLRLTRNGHRQCEKCRLQTKVQHGWKPTERFKKGYLLVD